METGRQIKGLVCLILAFAADVSGQVPEGVDAEVGDVGVAQVGEVGDPLVEGRERLLFFWAMVVGDLRTFCLALNGGMDPDCELPEGVPAEFLAALPDERLKYYARGERGFTPLMMAAALGRMPFVDVLLAAGADPARKTKRHRTFALWLAGKYGHVEIMRRLMGVAEGHPARGHVIEVSLPDQRARLLRFGQVVLEAPILSGRSSHPTPTGVYVVTDKYPMWKSTLYHARMPHFLRLSCGDFGLHAGRLPGYPASHGCIRLPADQARLFFEETPIGTLVEIR